MIAWCQTIITKEWQTGKHHSFVRWNNRNVSFRFFFLIHIICLNFVSDTTTKKSALADMCVLLDNVLNLITLYLPVWNELLLDDFLNIQFIKKSIAISSCYIRHFLCIHWLHGGLFGVFSIFRFDMDYCWTTFD